ncbi:GTPase [Sporanaerobium hydrogeniformans]|uniref:GTPase n=1 Tax=Sporanaerobium hydrogeniformans TaxID=3072179 RepID=A0AC61DC19_9FIRM|nr:GTPase [Sporanaerobium hydrogeniformans]PHV70301.1 GTPase [Sporanaerobium hydrogeniformans]
MKIPIFLLNGLLESGKTSFISHLLAKPIFADGKETLLIVCEEGVEDYEEILLTKNHVTLVRVDEEEELTEAFLKELNLIHSPSRVIMEYNGMWGLELLFDTPLPTGWFLYQSMVIVNGETFNLYFNNMRGMMMEHFKTAQLVIVNRMNEEMNIRALTGTVKAINSEVQLLSVSTDFVMTPIKEELPYDITKDVIEVSEEHYGIWYIDLWEEPNKYLHKKVKVSGLFFKEPSDPKDRFSFGRFAMPCCEDDIAFMGLYCHNIGKPRFQNKESVELLAEICWEEAPVYQGEGPVLHVKSIASAAKDQSSIISFG